MKKTLNKIKTGVKKKKDNYKLWLRRVCVKWTPTWSAGRWSGFLCEDMIWGLAKKEMRAVSSTEPQNKSTQVYMLAHIYKLHAAFASLDLWWVYMFVEWLRCKHVMSVYRGKGIYVGVSMSPVSELHGSQLIRAVLLTALTPDGIWTSKQLTGSHVFTS